MCKSLGYTFIIITNLLIQCLITAIMYSGSREHYQTLLLKRRSSRRWEDRRFATQPGSLLYLVGALEVCGDEGGLTPFGNGILIVARGIALSFEQV
jgi:hypothetical protein